MAPRKRSKGKTGWPDNLYERDGYYSYRNPLDGVEHGIGRNRKQAFDQAIEANLHIAGMADKPRLIHRITGEGIRTVEAWNTKYLDLLGQQDYAAVTLKSYKSLGKRMVEMLKPDTPLNSVTALKVSEILEATAVTEGKARLAQALRTFMRDSFREARVKGWYTQDNPVMDTKLSVPVVVNRARFTWETFQKSYSQIKLAWLRNAVDLALVSGQRREDISAAEFKDFHDGFWWLEQQSEKSETPHRIKIPLELRLDCFGKSLADVLSQCRRTGVLSSYLIHQTVRRGNSPLGRNIWIDTITKRFADAVKASGLDWSPKTPPTFHEIRSLAERLYADQGVDTTELIGAVEAADDAWVQVDESDVNTQHLLGHNDAETTAIYHDPRGVEWVQVKLGRTPK